MSASASRVPIYKNDPYMWFRAMYELGLMFHPEDDPADIIIDDPKAKGPGFIPYFTPFEVDSINKVISQIRDKWGDPCVFAYQVAVDVGDIKA